MLETALDIGVMEDDYYNYSIAEVMRLIASFRRKEKRRASEIYLLGELITIGTGCVLGDGSQEFPKMEDVFPYLFTDDIKPVEEKLDNTTVASMARFMQFAQFHNNKINQEEVLT